MSMMTGAKAEMNITPMIDVLLVLIVIFMISPAEKPATGFRAQIPQPATNSKAPPPESTIVLQLTGNERTGWRIRLNQEEVSITDLKARLQNIYNTRADKVLFVSAQRDTDFTRVAEVIDITHSADETIRIGLITETARNGD
jgi:biopolymer transport protein TolR